jgi:sigma-B regulation protein RsbU (phosphoserine phosphatase)
VDELEGSLYRNVISSEGMDRLYAMMKKLSNEKPLLTTEIRNVLPDGKVSWEQWNSRAIFDEKNKIIEIQNVGRDITPLKHAQEQLSLQSSALEAAANGIVITDRDGNILWANQALSRLTGYSLAEVTGKNPRIFKSGEMKLEFYRNMWDTICAGKVWSGEVINKKKDGSLYDEEMTITPISIGGGNISNFIAIKQDVTLRKEMKIKPARPENRLNWRTGPRAPFWRICPMKSEHR